MTTPARTPLLVVADDDPAERGLIEEELERRYGSDYTLRICTKPQSLRASSTRRRRTATTSPSPSRAGRREPTCSPGCAAASRRLGAAS